MKKISSFIKPGFTLLIALVYCFLQVQSTVIALSPEQKAIYSKNIQFYDVDPCSTGGPGPSDDDPVSINGETTEPKKAVQQVVWSTLTGGGLDAMHAAAVMGNIDQEGVWDPMNSSESPDAPDRSKDPSVTGSGYGYGLIGWTPGTRLLDSMREGNISGKPYTAETQAAVILAHIQGKTPSQYKPSVGKHFLKTKNIEDATTAYQGTDAQKGFENPADKIGSLPDRIAAAKRFLKKLEGTAVFPATVGGASVSACCPGSGGAGGSTTLTGKTNAEKILNYLVDNAELTDNQAAGAVGAMMLESGGNTLNIDPTAENPSSHAYGIAQWLGSRKTGLQDFATEKGGDISDLGIQAQYLIKEMESNINGYVNNEYKKKKTLPDAVKYWTDYFEGLVDSASQQLYDERTVNARTVLGEAGGSGGGASVSTPTASGSCACSEDSAAVDGKTVVIDPGHGPSKTTTDKATGLSMIESDNQPEGHDVWEVAQKIKKDLSGEGYNVILTKDSEDANVTFRQRAKIADNNHAALALSIHGDPGLPDPGEIFVQKVGLYRGSGSNKTTFKDTKVAQKSQQYAQIFKEERQKAGEGNVVIKDNSFAGRGLEPGNIPMVQLFSKTPWIYNEAKMSFNKDKYAEGLENSIKKVLGAGSQPQAQGQPASPSGGAGGDINSLLDDLAKKNGGKTSISVQSINGSTKGNANGDVQMPTRSSYKLYTAYATLRAIESGKVSWNTNVSASGWSGTIEDTMSQMIIYSNNSAAESLRLNNKIGSPDRVTSMLRGDLGLSNKTLMGSGNASDPHGSNSQSTSNDFDKFLISLYRHKLKGVNKDSSYNRLIALMKQASTDDGGKNRDGIVAGVGSGTEVADKPGWAGAGTDQASNDVGIVYLKDKPYVLSILTDKPYQWDGVANIAKEVNDFMSGASGGSTCAGGAVPGDLLATIKNYAWPDYADTRSDPKDEYKQAYDPAISQGQYGGGGYTDCGAFVTRAMIDSEFEPNYNYAGKVSAGAGPTSGGQMSWLKAKWQKVGGVSSTKDLQPGDVAISSSHTYVYVGHIDGFNGNSASASLGSRVPMASPAYDFGSFEWYRRM